MTRSKSKTGPNALDDDSQASSGATPQAPSAEKAITPDNETQQDAPMSGEPHEDDLCPICQLLLCNPVTTRCRHTMCKSCMATWADVSLAAPMTIVAVTEQARDFDAATGLEANCPMCRTRTSAALDEDRAHALRSQYPQLYSEREAEEAQDELEGESVQTITVYIGNEHRDVDPDPEGLAANKHEWTFFVRPSRTDIVEEIHIHLHPTFRQNHIIRSRPPYTVTRVGWGYFTITASVMLKAGYSWLSSDAEDSPDGAEKGMLRLEWMLDFSSFGSTGAMGRCRLKVKSARGREGDEWERASEEGERDEAEWGRMMRTYQRDGRYEPPVD